MRGKSDNLELVGVLTAHIKRLGSNRPSATEDRNTGATALPLN